METKIAILDDLKLLKQLDIAKKYDIPQSTVATIKKNEVKIRAMISRNEDVTKKRQRQCVAADLDEALFTWFSIKRAQNCSLSGPLLLEKAVQFSVQMSLSYKPDASWIERWRKRHNIHYKAISGEVASADSPAAEQYMYSNAPGNPKRFLTKRYL